MTSAAANARRLLTGLGLALALALLMPASPADAIHAPPATLDAIVAPASDAAERANKIDDFLAGRLSPSIDARTLFTTSLAGDDAEVLRRALSMREDRSVFRQAQTDPTILTGLSEDQARLAIKLAEFLRLPASRQAALFKAHAAREAAARATTVEAERLAARRDILRRQAEGLQAYLNGQFAPVVSLDVDLLDDGDVARLSNSQPISSNQPAEVPNATESVDDLQARVDRLRSRVLALPATERARLDAIQSQVRRREQASSAASPLSAQQSATAKTIASQTRLETDRRMAVQAQLFTAYRQSLAKATMALDERQATIDATADAALSWQQRVATFTDENATNTGADRQYLGLIDALRSVRSALGTALATPEKATADLLPLPVLDPLLPANDPRTAAMARQRNLLAVKAAQLESRAPAIGWKQRTALYDAMIAMNAARLQLIGSLSPEMRARVTGFDSAGLAQVQREAQQIVLSVRYNIMLGISRIGHYDDLLASSGSTAIIVLVELILITLIFRFWRQRGGAVLQAIEQDYLTRRPKTLATSFFAFAAGLAHKLGRPLDWLILLLLLAWLFPAIIATPAIELVWLVFVWLAAAATMVLFIDALFQGTDSEDPRAALRRRSLRLVIGMVLGVGLTLSLTMAAVGRGAIYNWVLTLCWLLVIPVVIILAQWWRARIDALAALGAPRNVVLAWSSRHPDGIAGRAGRIAAGAILLLQGAETVAARWINQLSLIREIASLRARNQASARVRLDEASGRFLPITLDEAERLSPHSRPQSSFRADIPVPELDQPSFLPGSLSTIIGERGLGKTTAIEQFLTKRPGPRQISLRTGISGLPGLLAALASELQCDATPEAICGKLDSGEHTIAIDDVQRLVVPAIGGLEGFDQLIALARASSDSTSWLFAIGGPAWSYLARARADRALFDDIVHLKRWHSRQIRALIERRSEQAGLQPAFSLDLQNAGTMLFDSDVTPEERARRQFFDELTEHAAGNPAVALEFWRRALFHDRETGSVAARTYRTPDTAALFALPKASLFVLRAILQMEVATTANIAVSTDLPSVVIRDSLRALIKLGVIGEVEGGHRLTLYWFQDVRRLLERQNLIVGRLAA